MNTTEETKVKCRFCDGELTAYGYICSFRLGCRWRFVGRDSILYLPS